MPPCKPAKKGAEPARRLGEDILANAWSGTPAYFIRKYSQN